ncbi:hypothetical protein ACU61S_24190 [Klebsiella aerogenes]
MKRSVLIPAVFFLSGCMHNNAEQVSEKYRPTTAKCSIDGNYLDCDWDNVTEDWKGATKDNFDSVHY